MKTFVTINSIVGITLLSSCSARPMNTLGKEVSHGTGVKSLQATSDLHPLQLSETEAPHSHTNNEKGALSLEEEVDAALAEADASAEHTKNLLMRIQNNRALASGASSGKNPPSNVEHGRPPSVDQGTVGDAAAWTFSGMRKEAEAQQARKEGRVEDSKQLYQEATAEQDRAFSLIKADGELHIDLSQYEGVEEESRKLNDQSEGYKQLPSKSELLAVIQSLDQDFAAKVPTPSSPKNQDTSILDKDREPSSSATHQDTSQLVEHLDPESLLINEDSLSVDNGKGKSIGKKAVEWVSGMYGSAKRTFLRTSFVAYIVVLMGQEAQALKCLRDGNTAEAVQHIKSMQHCRKQALSIHQQYQDYGYGTIELNNNPGSLYDRSQKPVSDLWATMDTNHEISSEKLKEIKARLGLDD